MAWLPIALQVAGGALAVSSQLKQAKKAEETSLEQAEVIESESRIASAVNQFNARQFEREAESVRDVTDIEEERISREARIAKGQIRTRFAKGGVRLTEGTPIDVLADEAEQFAIEKAFTARQGLIEQQKLVSQAKLERVQAQLTVSKGKQLASTTRRTGEDISGAQKLGAVSTILSTSSSILAQRRQNA